MVPAIVTRKSYHFCQRSIFDGLYIISLIAKRLITESRTTTLAPDDRAIVSKSDGVSPDVPTRILLHLQDATATMKPSG